MSLNPMNNSTHKVIPIAVLDSKIQHQNRARRTTMIKWLRKLHGWIGLWGATLGLLFGTSGILLNHRAVMKIPAAQIQESLLQIPLPNPTPANADAMATWLQHKLNFDRPAARVRSEPEKDVAWGDKTMRQPAHWSVAFNSPRSNFQAEYWQGNSFVSVRRSENNVFAILNNLHKGTGAGVGWVLLVDTLAGSIIFLSLSGVLLWSLQNRRRLVGAAIGITAIVIVIALTAQTM